MRRAQGLAFALVLATAAARLESAPLESQSVELAGVYRLARLADADGDGILDLLVLAAGEGWDPASPEVAGRIDAIHVFAGAGGALRRTATIALPLHASSMDAADVDGDRNPEIVAATASGILPCRVASGQSGICAPAIATALHLHDERSTVDAPLAADLDGDGVADLALPVSDGVEHWIWREGIPAVARERVLVPVPAFVLGSEAPSVVAQLARRSSPPSITLVRPLLRYLDLEGDGGVDLALPLRQRLGALEGIRVRFGTAEGALAPSRDVLLPLGKGELVATQDELAFGDADGDGRPDVGVLSYDLERLGITQTRRLRVFGFAEGFVPRSEPLLDVETSSNVWEPSLLAIGDLDGDRAGDVLVVHVGGLRKAAVTLEWYRRDGERFREQEQTLKLPKDDDVDRGALRMPADVDGDGKVDLVVQGEKVVHLFAGTLSGGSIVDDAPAATLRPRGAEKVLAVLSDGEAHRLWAIVRRSDGKNEVHRLLPRATSAR